jgi:aminoglycoside phosphotransferase
MPGAGEVEICIRPDGRIYFAVLTEELLEIAAALCPDDQDLARRLALARKLRSDRSDESDGSDEAHGSDSVEQVRSAADAQTKERSDGAETADS